MIEFKRWMVVSDTVLFESENSPEIRRLVPVARIHSCFTEKFGIPRQPGLVSKAPATMEVLPPFNRREMFTGLEKFSHIWIHFLFHDTLAEGWKATVRPPGLGGRTRVGIFASRSPHRPNFLGLSVVRLLGIRYERGGVFLDLVGVDVLDQTPVFDIKPYLPYSDAIGDAVDGYAREPKDQVHVSFSDDSLAFALIYQRDSGRDLVGLISEILQQDPRPASQKDGGREFGMRLWNINVRWQVRNDGFFVTDCRPVTVR